MSPVHIAMRQNRFRNRSIVRTARNVSPRPATTVQSAAIRMTKFAAKEYSSATNRTSHNRARSAQCWFLPWLATPPSHTIFSCPTNDCVRTWISTVTRTQRGRGSIEPAFRIESRWNQEYETFGGMLCVSLANRDIAALAFNRLNLFRRLHPFGTSAFFYWGTQAELRY